MALLPASIRARLRAVRLLQPLERRDFALLTTGSVVSLLGDGFFSIALAWQVYEISNVPTALSVVGVAWTVPLIAFLLLGGVFTDRYDRRRLMIGADLIRAAAIGLLGVLSLAGVIELWHVIVLIAFVGLGDAFFNPAATAIVPDLLPDELLPQANALNGLIRPLTIRLIGPALGGFVVALSSAGTAFLIDAASFLVSAVAIAAITPSAGARGRLPRRAPGDRRGRGGACLCPTDAVAVGDAPVGDVQPALLHRAGAGAAAVPGQEPARARARGARRDLRVGGIGSVVSAIAIGQLGLPRRYVTVMYAAGRSASRCWPATA